MAEGRLHVIRTFSVSSLGTIRSIIIRAAPAICTPSLKQLSHFTGILNIMVSAAESNGNTDTLL